VVQAPALTQASPLPDGSILVRWFRDVTKAEKAAVKRWIADHPNANITNPKAMRTYPIRWSTPTEPDGYGPMPLAGELQAWLADPDDDSDEGRAVTSVLVTLADPLSPNALQRLPWARLLVIVDAQAKAWHAADGHQYATMMDEAFGRAWGDGGPPRRPGRRGHPDEWYQAVAARYLALRLEGVTDPTNQIAIEANYNRSTVAGWVSTARKKGYLPPARRGKPG
jgi:hypothetical protein